MPEKSAIRDLMDEVAAARSLAQLYDRALDCMRRTLDVERSAVMLLTGPSMQFVAWHGISAQYREAVDGHSPWGPGDSDARPILVPDIEEDPHLEALRPALRAENVRALACIPMHFGAKLLGKFVVFYREPHEFTDNEVTIAEIIAGHVAFAIEHRRIAGELEARADSESLLRRQAEHEGALRRDNERRMKLAMAAGRMGAWSWEIASGRVEWSGELEVLHAITAGTFGGTIEDFERDIHPADRALVTTAIQRALADPDGEYEVEYRILPPDGGLRWLYARGKVLSDLAGSPARLVGVCTDISERKRAEESEAFLMQASRMLATTLNPDVAVQSLTGIVVPRFADWCVIQILGEGGELHPVGLSHVDPAKREIGWRVVEKGGLRLAESVVRTGRSNLLAHVDDDALRRRIPEPEVNLAVRQLGIHSMMTVPLAVRGRVLGTLTFVSAEPARSYGFADLRVAEEIGSWSALALDNAALVRRAEEARATAETANWRLELLAELSSELAMSLDPESMLRTLSERLAATMADFAVTYAYDGRTIRRYGMAHRLSAKLPLLRKVNENGDPSITDDTGAGFVIRTGEAILLPAIDAATLRNSALNAAHHETLVQLSPRSSMVVPMIARGRTLGAITIVATSDSDRRYGAEDLRLATELASRAALLVDNARLYAEARAAITARDDMVAVVSHDLRNPLQTIASAAALLELSPAAAHRARTLESITVATAQMDRLLNDLLDISRIEAGKFIVEPVPTDVRDVIDEVVALFSPLVERKSIRLTTEITDDVPAAALDRARIVQVLSNLLGNALRVVSPGGHIRVSVLAHEGSLRFEVEDDGCGIEEEHLERLFDRYWRLGRGDQNPGGAGLGLALVKGIVEAHGGAVGVESQVGKGSRFHFVLAKCYDDERCAQWPVSEMVS